MERGLRRMAQGKKLVAMIMMGLLLVGGAFSLTGCGGAAEQKVIKIGVVGPESGGAAQLGQGQRKAVQMAVDEINAKNEA